MCLKYKLQQKTLLCSGPRPLKLGRICRHNLLLLLYLLLIVLVHGAQILLFLHAARAGRDGGHRPPARSSRRRPPRLRSLPRALSLGPRRRRRRRRDDVLAHERLHEVVRVLATRHGGGPRRELLVVELVDRVQGEKVELKRAGDAGHPRRLEPPELRRRELPLRGELPLFLHERALRHRIVERHPVLLQAVKLLQLAQPHGREVLELDARVRESLALLVGQRVLGVIRRPRPHPREPHRQG
mmetsp:Transcript_4342/g.19410  ORF Transcript_4342/g.19410 Transcript_4342/m.19410 type:complete len:242 (+) Transcript_4342:953-1678(+)